MSHEESAIFSKRVLVVKETKKVRLKIGPRTLGERVRPGEINRPDFWSPGTRHTVLL